MKFLIIGAGMIGETHTRVLKKMGHEVALCDKLAKNLNYLGDKFGIEKRYGDASEGLRDFRPDAAVICTPNHLHREAAVKALEYGCDVLCEKPIASSVEDAKAMLEAQEKSGKKLMIGYIVRAYDALDKVREILSSDKIGKIVSARCILATPETLDVAKTRYRVSYETGGGIIYDYTHELDYCRMLFGEPGSAFAFCGSYLRPEESVDDSADILIRYRSGLVLELHLDYIQRSGRNAYSRSFEIICENATVSCDFKSVTVEYNDRKGKEEYSFDPDWDRMFTKQASRFIELVNGNENVPHATGLDGLKAIELADALYRSAREGVMITF